MVEIKKEELIVRIVSASPSEELHDIQKALLSAIEVLSEEQPKAALVRLLESTLLDSQQLDKSIGNSHV